MAVTQAILNVGKRICLSPMKNAIGSWGSRVILRQDFQKNLFPPSAGFSSFFQRVQPSLRDREITSIRQFSYSAKSGQAKRWSSKVVGYAAAVLASAILFAEKAEACTPVIAFSCHDRQVEGIYFAKRCKNQYPEVSWLASSSVRNTEEGVASKDPSYSEQIFGKKYIEFDRAVMSMHCMRLILEGSDEAYEVFTRAQNLQDRLSREGFAELHQTALKMIRTEYLDLTPSDIAQAMEAALVLGDMGKSEIIRNLFKSYGVTAPDHDDFYHEAMRVLMYKEPSLCPTFGRLSPNARKLLFEASELGVHYGHITHLEGGTKMFRGLKDHKIDPFVLLFDLFVHTCDVAGALGHVNKQSSLVYTESTHRAMQAMWKSVRLLTDPKNDERDAYHYYLNERAKWLGLDLKEKTNCILTRIGAMMRLFTPEEGEALKNAIANLTEKQRQQVEQELNPFQKDPWGLSTPTYMPAVLVNLANNPALGETRMERLQQAVEIGLPVLSRALALHKRLVHEGAIDPTIPLCFNKLAGIAKMDPENLQNELMIDKQGNIDIILEKE